MHRSLVALVLLLGIPLPAAFAMPIDNTSFQGTWMGVHNGTEVVWRVEEDGRLRIDGRPADYQVHGDTLVVCFDAPTVASSGASRETAVYRFLASVPQRGGLSRLFVYGFDLGRQGLHLVREAPPEAAPSEDCAPAAPPGPGGSLSPQASARPSPPARAGGH